MDICTCTSNFVAPEDDFSAIRYGVNTKDPSLSKFSSVKGRLFCVINLVGHVAGTVLKTAIYALAAIFFAIYSCCQRDKVLAAASGIMLAMVVGCPIAQTGLALKAFLGIFHPGLYYKSVEEDNKNNPPVRANLEAPQPQNVENLRRLQQNRDESLRDAQQARENNERLLQQALAAAGAGH